MSGRLRCSGLSGFYELQVDASGLSSSGLSGFCDSCITSVYETVDDVITSEVPSQSTRRELDVDRGIARVKMARCVGKSAAGSNMKD